MMVENVSKKRLDLSILRTKAYRSGCRNEKCISVTLNYHFGQAPGANEQADFLERVLIHFLSHEVVSYEITGATKICDCGFFSA